MAISPKSDIVKYRTLWKMQKYKIKFNNMNAMQEIPKFFNFMVICPLYLIIQDELL
jgi:hypothetical protein